MLRKKKRSCEKSAITVFMTFYVEENVAKVGGGSDIFQLLLWVGYIVSSPVLKISDVTHEIIPSLLFSRVYIWFIWSILGSVNG